MRPLRLPLPLLAAFAFAASLPGCKVNVDFGGTHFTCTDGKCPDGFECVSGTCVLPGGGGIDAAIGGGADGAQSLIDAAPGAPDANLAAVCDGQFLTADNGYVLCASGPDPNTAGATSCEFYATTNGVNCDTECTNLGGSCLDGWNADAPDYCTRLTNDGCLTTHTDQICICSTAPPAA